MTATRKVTRGRGSVYQAKGRDGKLLRDVWRIAYSWTDSNHERHRIYETWHGKKTGALERLDQIDRNHKGGLRAGGGSKTLGAFALEWQRAREESGELAAKTLTESRRYVRAICDRIGETPLEEVTPQTVDDYISGLRRTRRGADGGSIGNRTLLAYYQCLKQVLQKAVDYDYIMRNPCAKVKPPKPGEVERRSLSLKDARRLLEAIDRSEREEWGRFEDKERRQREWGADGGRESLRGLHDLANLAGARIALATGLRMGEVLGLTWEGVNLADQCITVSQSLDANGDTKPPKTAAGRRTVWIDLATANALAQWKRRQAAQLRKIGAIRAGEKVPGKTPVVCSDVGGYSNPSNYGAWWRTWRESHGFPGLKFHELRHTQATQLLANGVDVKTVQARLGHSDPALTLKWYAHSIEENDRQAAALLGGLLTTGGG